MIHNHVCRATPKDKERESVTLAGLNIHGELPQKSIIHPGRLGKWWRERKCESINHSKFAVWREHLRFVEIFSCDDDDVVGKIACKSNRNGRKIKVCF
jgi:hypothetical protein